MTQVQTRAPRPALPGDGHTSAGEEVHMFSQLAKSTGQRTELE